MFDLGSLLPSGASAAAAGQAAPDILNSYNKGQMDFLALENALQNQKKQQRADLIAEQYLPIEIAVKNLKTIQDVNVAPGTVMPEVNPFDLESQMNYLRHVTPMTNAEADILKAKAQSEYGLKKTEFTQDEITKRAKEEIAKDLKIKNSERATKKLENMMENFKNIRKDSSKTRLNNLLLDLESLAEYKDEQVFRAAIRRFGPILKEAGIEVPGIAAPAAPQAPVPQTPAQLSQPVPLVQSNTPPGPGAIRVLKNGRKFQLQPNGRYKEIP
jgi:hypothetical protein